MDADDIGVAAWCALVAWGLWDAWKNKDDEPDDQWPTQ